MLRPLLIALDYDGTYTEDKWLWDAFIKMARTKGHTVIVATMRISEFESEIVEHELRDKVNDIIYTDRKAKREEVIKQYGQCPDIWIDDNPGWIFTDAADIR